MYVLLCFISDLNFSFVYQLSARIANVDIVMDAAAVTCTTTSIADVGAPPSYSLFALNADGSAVEFLRAQDVEVIVCAASVTGYVQQFSAPNTDSVTFSLLVPSDTSANPQLDFVQGEVVTYPALASYQMESFNSATIAASWPSKPATTASILGRSL